jgi:hypothetical protein
VRFDALYDLTILETELGAQGSADDWLRQVGEHVETDKLRKARLELLTARIEYVRGDLVTAEERLNRLTVDDFSPTRQGIRWMYLASCLEGLNKPGEVQTARSMAERCFKEAEDVWHTLQMRADEINRALDRGDDVEASRVIGDTQKLLDGLGEGYVSRVFGDSFGWVNGLLDLSKARLSLLKCRLGRSGAEDAGTVRRHLERSLSAAQRDGLVRLEVWSHIALAEVADIEQQNDAEIGRRYKEAIDLTDDMGLLSEAARARGKRAEYRRRRGDRDGCRQDIQDAIAIWKKLGNDTWVRRLNEYLDYPGCSVPARSDGDREPGPNSSDMGP